MLAHNLCATAQASIERNPAPPHVNVPGESHHPIQGRRLRISTYRRSPEIVLLGRPCERLTHVYKFIVHAPSD